MSVIRKEPSSLELIPEVVDWTGAVRGKFAERENLARKIRPITLFDEKERHYSQPSLRAETTYSFYDRSCLTGFGHLREMLQRWLGRLPPEKQKGIVARMRHTGPGSPTEQKNFDSAFFELFLHEFLVGTGGAVVVEPTIEGLTPDFGVTERKSDGEVFSYVVEATDINVLSNSALDSDWNEDHALDVLDEIESPDFFLNVRTDGRLMSTPPKSALQRPFKELIQESNYDRVCAIAELHGYSEMLMPSAKFEHGDWQLTGHLLPVARDRRPNRGRFVGIGPIKAGWPKAPSKLKNRLYEKGKKYSKVERLIIAVRGDWNLERDELAEALFGTQVHRFFVPDPAIGSQVAHPAGIAQKPDGFWFNSQGSINRNVIGVAMFPSLYPQNIDLATATFFANPYSDSPLPDWARKVGHAVYESENVRFVEGDPVGAFALDHEPLRDPWASAPEDWTD